MTLWMILVIFLTQMVFKMSRQEFPTASVDITDFLFLYLLLLFFLLQSRLMSVLLAPDRRRKRAAGPFKRVITLVPTPGKHLVGRSACKERSSVTLAFPPCTFLASLLSLQQVCTSQTTKN